MKKTDECLQGFAEAIREKKPTIADVIEALKEYLGEGTHFGLKFYKPVSYHGSGCVNLIATSKQFSLLWGKAWAEVDFYLEVVSEEMFKYKFRFVLKLGGEYGQLIEETKEDYISLKSPSFYRECLAHKLDAFIWSAFGPNDDEAHHYFKMLKGLVNRAISSDFQTTLLRSRFFKHQYTPAEKAGVMKALGFWVNRKWPAAQEANKLMLHLADEDEEAVDLPGDDE